ncbi:MULTISPECIES: hypothetical protein [Xanthobacter]|jgi:hypothetical protein|uniref:Uncharacterized protein n=1 Tax=Xanthobacter aminoxidans TaxID=186280 RepID=A0ABW6ZP46_9HYPH|nr:MULTISPECIES: hypothetical protein [Xanthobacter]MCL8385632.1 hypothetical protein [Xanthobacter aminoxidans]
MSDEAVIIHARFAANGTIAEISERPQGLNPQEWFDFLSYRVPLTYQALAGGRGVFRLTRADVDAFKVEAATKAA